MPDFAGEYIRWWKPQGFSGVEALSVRNSPRLWKVYHETFTVCTVLGDVAAAEWECRGRRHVSGQGSLMLMDQGEVHNTGKLSAPGTFWVLFLDTAYMSRVAEDILGIPMPRWRFSDFRDADAFRSFAQLHAVLQSPLPMLAKETHLLASVAGLLSKAAEKAPIPEPRIRQREGLRRARDFLHAHFAEEIRLDDLAYHACTTPSHLCRTFAMAYGIPPHQYLIRLRVAKAKAMLAEGAPFLPADLGFCDQAQFNRLFKQVNGMTPRNYRVQLRIPRLGGPDPD